MVATLVTAVVLSLVKMRLRWTVLRHMRLGYIAKNIVAAGLAKRQKCNWPTLFGVAQPVSVRIDTLVQEQ